MRIGSCQTFGSSYSFLSVIHHSVSQLGMHEHTVAEVERAAVEKGEAVSEAVRTQTLPKKKKKSAPKRRLTACEWPETTPQMWRCSHLLILINSRILEFSRGLSGLLRICLARGTQHLSEAPHRSPPSTAESGRYHSALQLGNDKYIHLVQGTLLLGR